MTVESGLETLESLDRHRTKQQYIEALLAVAPELILLARVAERLYLEMPCDGTKDRKCPHCKVWQELGQLELAMLKAFHKDPSA